MDEPVVLEGLPEVARSVLRDEGADFGDPLELGLPARVFLLSGQLTGSFGVSFCVADQSVGRHRHGLELLFFVESLRIGEETQAFNALADIPLEIHESFLIDLVIQNGVAGRPLLHELSENAGLVGGLPSFVHLGEDPLPYSLSPPEREYFLFIAFSCLRVDLKRGLGAAVEDVEVLEAMGGDLRISRRRFGARPPLTDDQLSVLYAYSFVFKHIPEGQGPLHGHGESRRSAFPVEVGQEQSPLGRDRRFSLQSLLSQFLDALVHGYSPRITRKPYSSRSFFIRCKHSAAGGVNSSPRACVSSPCLFSRRGFCHG